VSTAAGSLLTYIDTPVVVGDPDGRVAYVNPAFEKGFSVDLEGVMGQPLAHLFDGGAREFVLASVAEACELGETVRFRIRQGGVGFGAIASPIVAEDARVGVALLLVELAATDERSLTLCREMTECLDDLGRILDEMLEQTGGRRAERYRALVEDGVRALGRAHKWSGELESVISGKPASAATPSRFDPVAVLRDAAARARPEFESAGLSLEVLVPAQLPELRGDGGLLELALSHLLRIHRVGANDTSLVTMSARIRPRGDGTSVVISVIGSGAVEGDAPEEDAFSTVRSLVEEIGGEIRISDAPLGGRATVIRLMVA